jgi:hypothetical protein
MNTVNQKLFYSPPFSEMTAVSVRRLAWALQTPMGKAVDFMVSCLPAFIQTEKVCAACKDKSKCKNCTFAFAPDAPEQAASLLYP